MMKICLRKISAMFLPAKAIYLSKEIISLLSIMMLISFKAGANNYVVTSTNNAGAGSLRQAITNANGLAGPHTITFSVSGTINLSTDLPTLVQNITIDGFGQTVIISRNSGGGDQANYLFTIGTGASGSVIKNLTLKNTGNEVLHVDGTSLSNLAFQNIVCSNDGGDYFNFAIYFAQNISNVTIRNFTAYNLQNSWNGLHFVGTASDITIDSFITVNGPGTGGKGIYFAGAATNINITRCVINSDEESTTDDGDYGIQFNSTVTGLSTDSLAMHDTEINGILVNGTATNVTITNSTFDNFDGSGGNEMIRFVSSMNQLTMTNLTIDMDQSGTTDDGDYGIVFSGAVSDVTLTNVSVNEADYDGIATSSTATNFTINGGRLTKNYDGIEFYSCTNNRNVKFQDTRIENSTRYGIVLPACSGGLSDSVAFVRDTLTGNGYGGIYVYSADVATMVTIQQCVASGNGYTSGNGAGIEITYPDNVVMTQNSVYNNAGQGIELTNGGTGNCNLEGANAPVINSVTSLGSNQYQVQFTPLRSMFRQLQGRVFCQFNGG